ncbi:MAG TPA: T9SS type A sorting domain-containing protein [Chitinophagaceae bacterium]
MRIFYLVFLIVFLTATGANAQSRTPGFPDNGSPATVRFYPNPATSFITFEDFAKKYDKNYTIQLFNFLGKKVFEFNLNDQKNIVNLSDFFRGIYIFQLRDPSGKILESGKFQVNK